MSKVIAHQEMLPNALSVFWSFVVVVPCKFLVYVIDCFDLVILLILIFTPEHHPVVNIRIVIGVNCILE